MIVLLNILIVVALFNVIIFVHELGHFLAAKWRGLRIDRFQIWFGKPLWKKEINGVQYGLGWLPAGGFVALPQMAPMEAVEGKNRAPGDPEEREELEERRGRREGKYKAVSRRCQKSQILRGNEASA